ncbi:hypothetical protein Tco_0877362 [Tanacetum coccineum]|uniref:Uncharacterized protein n=1 Tax=Tanacetum coccineum TaxID=301880 RepID=A0ABQ5BV71_9ASTR
MPNSSLTEFSVTEEEGLHKGYDRFQKILELVDSRAASPAMMTSTREISSALPSRGSQVALALKQEVLPTHSAFQRSCPSSGSKLNYSNQQSIVPPVSQTSGRSDSIMECVLHSFVAENEPNQDMIYEDFDQVNQLEMEDRNLKWANGLCSP